MFLKNNKNFFKIILVFIIVGIVSVVFSSFTNRSPCILFNITNLPCPSCGMTRAWISVLSLDFKHAFSYHPLFLAVIIIPFLFLNINGKELNEKLRNKILIGFIISFLVFGIGRVLLLLIF